MAKIPFDIKYKPQIESGEYKVETRDGRPIRIICWDFKHNKYPIIALYAYSDNTECLFTYDINGCYHPGENHGKDMLIVTPEPELSEFEKAIGEEIFDPPFNDEQVKVIREESVKLLALATEELKKKFVLLHKDDYQTVLDLCKNEALKDLPRWEKWGNGACGNGRGIPIAIVKRWNNDYQLVDALGIQGEQYIMLSDLEKLPGFKEDSHD